ncbi:MAG: DUF4386 domain-containing protein [Trueperaceae bacterium]|nr:DUF4386 domain-containing protein [Trueperaceae bacterium]
MTAQNPTLPTAKLARFAGLAYLVIFLAGFYAEFYVRPSLINQENPFQTAQAIRASETLFRSSIAGDIIMILADIILALLFYQLFKPVSRSLSLVAAVFRLAQASTLAVNLLNLFIAMQLFQTADTLASSNGNFNDLGMIFLNAHSIGYSLGLVFFGINCLLMAYLIFKASYFPTILGALVMLAGLGYLITSFAQVILPNYANYQGIFEPIVLLPAVVGELAMCLWLLIKGIRLSTAGNASEITLAQ